jgi:hypothetical protein
MQATPSSLRAGRSPNRAEGLSRLPFELEFGDAGAAAFCFTFG